MALFTTWTERFESYARNLVAYAVMLCLFLFNVSALSYPLSGSIKVPLVLMAIYYWSVYRPTLIPPFLVFCVGIGFDLISGFPLGLNALFFVLTRWIVTSQRRFLMGQSFFMVWVVFALVNCVFMIAFWLIFGLLQLAWPNIFPVLFNAFLGVVAFPIVCIPLHLSHKALPQPGSGFNQP